MTEYEKIPPLTNKQEDNSEFRKIKFPTKDLPNLDEINNVEQFTPKNVKFPTKELILPEDMELLKNPLTTTKKYKIIFRKDPEAMATFTSSRKPLHPNKKDNVSTEYLEAYELYTPMFPSQPDAPDAEIAEEEPLISEAYIPPFNIFEELVETELNIILARYVDICRCAQCRSDIVALSLQQLPSYYVTGSRGTETAKRIISSKYMQRIMNAVTKSIQVVYKKPRSTCKRVRHVLWIKPYLEEAISNSIEPPLTEPTEFPLPDTDEPELNFPDEVEELIHLVTNSSPQNGEKMNAPETKIEEMKLIEELEEEDERNN